ncbi:unknown [Clostridium sp. CAG:356]|nr:unknown [Clostridium sp. CAG:356]
MREFSGAWRQDKSESMIYPNGQIAREVWRNVATGAKIVRRYNELGNLIYTNERYRKYS